MKSLLLYLSLLIPGILCYGCASSGSDNTLSDELNKAAKVSGNAGGNSCILKYAEKLDELLTADLAAEISGLPAATAEFKYSKVLKDPFYHSATYSWKSDRTKSMTFGNSKIDVPLSDKIEVKGIKATTLAAFTETRRNRTDEELAQMNQQIDNALSGKTDNPKIKEQLDKLDRLGVDKESARSTGASLGSSIGKVIQSYSDVEGIGSAARWNSAEQILYVWEDGTEFAVSAEVSADENLNKQKSIALARKVLDNCN